MENSLDLTKKLIEIPSVSGNEAQILEFLERFLSKNGAEVKRTADFVAGVFRNEKSKSSKRAVILTGHIDTVASGDLSGWQNSPWQAIETDEKIIGLGASDMKAGIAASFCSDIDFWAGNGERADFDLWLVAVSNEEIDGSGSAKFAEWLKKSGRNYEEIYGLISEPTGNQQIEVGHRGNRFVEFNFLGISGHASQQDNFEKSALAKASKFTKNLDNIYQKLQEKYSNQILGAPSIVATSLSAGDSTSPNKTAGEATLICDIRTTPELDADFENFINSLAKEFDFSWKYHSEPAPSCLISSDSKVVKTLTKVANLGDNSAVVSPGATDQAFFVNGLGAEIVVFGPGEFSEAHHQNEFIYKQKITDFYQICKDFLREI
ncbi:MAG: M20/M25/M40 family metallo-hydrolase [bacterium]|nr:M20/M25/M40 family metallo-hydrolase [bacterium]